MHRFTTTPVASYNLLAELQNRVDLLAELATLSMGAADRVLEESDLPMNTVVAAAILDLQQNLNAAQNALQEESTENKVLPLAQGGAR